MSSNFSENWLEQKSTLKFKLIMQRARHPSLFTGYINFAHY